MKIKNKTKLNYSEVGAIIDILKEKADKSKEIVIMRNRKKYKVTIKYGLRDVTWVFEEVK